MPWTERVRYAEHLAQEIVSEDVEKATKWLAWKNQKKEAFHKKEI